MYEIQGSSTSAHRRLIEQYFKDAFSCHRSAFSLPSLSKLLPLVPIESLSWPLARNCSVSVDVLRVDLLHPEFGGNKLFKLWGHMRAYCAAVSASDFTPIASFGGAFSNHLYALAGLGKLLSIPTIGIVRGERPSNPSSTLVDLADMGMTLHFIDRQLYKKRSQPGFVAHLARELGIDPCTYWIPEGGAGDYGLVGAEALGKFIHGKHIYSHVVHACGTGTSLAGLVKGAQSANKKGFHTKYIGISALKSDQALVKSVSRHLGQSGVPISWSLTNQYHCGGFAKLTSELSRFMLEFYEQTAIPTDRVYTGKVFYALSKMLSLDLFPRDSRVLVVHSGGLQGNRA